MFSAALCSGRVIEVVPITLAAGMLLAGVRPTAAHSPEGFDAAAMPLPWTTDPLVLGSALVLALGYLLGLGRLWSRAGPGRGIPRWRAAAFALGLASLFVALVSPLDAAADLSFAAHMGQHMLLVVVAAPLVASGNAGVVLLTALPGTLRHHLGRGLASRPMRRLRHVLVSVPVATALHGVTVWLWHAPVFYEAALANGRIHYLEHLTMFGTGVLFWWSVLGRGEGRLLGQGAGVVGLFVTIMHGGLLGILILLAPSPLYQTYAAGTVWGMSPLEDQQIAGMIMLAGGLAYLAAGLAQTALWLAAVERRNSLVPAASAAVARRRPEPPG